MAIKGLVLPISGITADYHPTNNTFIALLHVHCTLHILYTQSKVAMTEDPPSSTLPLPPSLLPSKKASLYHASNSEMALVNIHSAAVSKHFNSEIFQKRAPVHCKIKLLLFQVCMILCFVYTEYYFAVVIKLYYIEETACNKTFKRENEY